MNCDLLKELYRYYWVQRDQDQWWYDEYKKTVGKVAKRRTTLNQYPLSATDDEDLLSWLIEEKSSSGNGISNARLCMLSHQNYERLVSDAEFLAAAKGYMQNPSQAGYEGLVSAGRQVIDAINDEPAPAGEEKKKGGNAISAVQQVCLCLQPRPFSDRRQWKVRFSVRDID